MYIRPFQKGGVGERIMREDDTKTKLETNKTNTKFS